MEVYYLKKIILYCPECGSRLIDSNFSTESEMKSEEKIPLNWHPDYFQKCWKCGKQIGIKKVS